MTATAPGITPMLNAKGESYCSTSHICPLYLSEQKLPQNIPLNICLYFIVQNYVTSVLLARKETDKSKYRVGDITNPNANGICSLEKWEKGLSIYK